jgi:N-acetylglucosamine kinase-like BadF-type ATPase
MSRREGKLLLGIDGGGTSTSALLARDDGPRGWQALGRGASGCGNIAIGDPAAARANLQAAIAGAFDHAGLPPQSVDFACFALAGSDRASVREPFERWLGQQEIASHWMLVHDAQPLLAWAEPDETAVALIAGTGSLAWGRNGRGQSARAGGWGPLLGDEGSGYWLGLQALRAVVRHGDGRGPTTRLSSTLPVDWANLDDLRHLPLQAQTRGRDAIAALSTWVSAAADAGDGVAEEILDEAVRQLAELVLAVARQLDATIRLDRLALAGGVLLHRPRWPEQIRSRLQQQGMSVAKLECIADPVRGAVELAYRACSR